MRAHRRRPTYYTVSCLHDGTVIAAYPVRKPSLRILKRDGQRIDADNVCREFPRSGKELTDVHNESRMRFQDIISVAINTRRIVRELVLPELRTISEHIDSIRNQIDRLAQAMLDKDQK